MFTLKLMEGYANPVVELEDYYNLLALIDTGASIPVMMLSEDTVIAMGGQLKQTGVNVKGLSHNPNRGNIYKLENFKFGDILHVEKDNDCVRKLLAYYVKDKDKMYVHFAE